MKNLDTTANNYPKRTKRSNGEGTVYQRPDGRWIARISIGTRADGTPHRKTFTGATKKEAVAKMEEYKRLFPAHGAPVEEGLTVREALTGCAASVARNIRTATRSNSANGDM